MSDPEFEKLKQRIEEKTREYGMKHGFSVKRKIGGAVKQIELCARNVSAALRETWNAINAANEVSWHDTSAEEEETLKMALDKAVTSLEAANEILSRRQRSST